MHKPGAFSSVPCRVMEGSRQQGCAKVGTYFADFLQNAGRMQTVAGMDRWANLFSLFSAVLKAATRVWLESAINL